MKKTLTGLICILMALGLATDSLAAKKNMPKDKDVEKELEKIGGEHFPEDLDVNKVGSIKYQDSTGEDNYYHVFNASKDSGGYRIIFYDNTPKYLGFYPSQFEAIDYGETEVLLDSGESDADGNTTYFVVPIDAKGPAEKIRIDGIPTQFVKAPGADAKKSASGIGKTAGGGAAGVAEGGDEGPQYRDWKITIQGKERVYNAVFVSVEKGQVSIKESKRGQVATVPVSALSEEDVEYLKELLAK